MHRQALSTRLAPIAHLDGEWLRCNVTACDAFFGAFRPTDALVAKFAEHRARKHAARFQAQAGRPQRRRAAAAAALAQGISTDLRLELAAAMFKAFDPTEADAQSNGWAFLGAGIHRSTFDMGNGFVVKFGSGAAGRAANQAEARTWAACPASRQRWLCPVVASAPTGHWLVMPLATGFNRWAVCEQVQDAIGDVIQDLHAGNCAMWRGQPVATDYGFGGAW